jgi:hypothetical protein
LLALLDLVWTVGLVGYTETSKQQKKLLCD